MAVNFDCQFCHLVCKREIRPAFMRHFVFSVPLW